MISYFLNFLNFFTNLGPGYKTQTSLFFKDPATSLMENIIELHNFIFYFILIISGLVLWLLIQIIDQFINLYHIDSKYLYKQNINHFITFNFTSSSYNNKNFKENKILEASWTILPALILILISSPSFYMLYLSEETIQTLLTVKAIGYQWYWTYDYSDLFPIWYNLVESNLDIDDFTILSYIEPTEYLDFSNGHFRLLETDDFLILPTNLHLRLIITSMDTLHSFGLPSLGLKIDAIPGRLNKIDIYIYRMGTYYGQCSEICGIGHGFMPIELNAVSYLNFLIGQIS